MRAVRDNMKQNVKALEETMAKIRRCDPEVLIQRKDCIFCIFCIVFCIFLVSSPNPSQHLNENKAENNQEPKQTNPPASPHQKKQRFRNIFFRPCL